MIRGQAALVDSLFFIAIVAALCTGLFYFAINYGSNSESLLYSFYSSDFATDSLKVMTYINVMRDGSPVNATNAASSTILVNPEFDYLLALIKEDYAENTGKGKEAVSITTQTAIAQTIYSVLKPFDDSIDYVFYISKEGVRAGEAKFLVMIFALHKCFSDDCTYQNPNKEVRRVFYACEPSQSNVLEKFVFSNVGKVDSALGKINLGSSAGSFSPFVTGLHLWVSKRIEPLEAVIETSELEDPAQRESNFNCKLILTKGEE